MANQTNGIKKSAFAALTEAPDGATFDFVSNGQNFKILKSDLLTGLGVTGTIVQAGAVTGTPVLDVSGTINNIRNLEFGAGISGAVSPENGISIAHNFTQDLTGLPVLINPTEDSPTIASLTGSGGITVTASDGNIDISGDAASFSQVVIVKQSSDLAGTLDSTKVYYIDGVIDMGLQSIEVPAGGLYLTGFNFDVSKLTSSATGYTMFTSPVGGSGNLLGTGYGIEVTGSGSKVYDLVSATGDEAFEFSIINYNNCTSLGTIDNYRQGLELGTGRFGGQPSLELKGVWAGGYRITTSIVRSIDDAMTEPLFKAGTGFTMSSRFLTDINVDLGALAPFADFAPSNFLNPSTLQVTGAIISRNGVFDPEDATIFPNINQTDLASAWTNNNGLVNTFEGGNAVVSVEVATVVSATSTYYDLNGTWATSDLQHFDSPSNGQLRHLGDNPREYRLIGDLILDSTSGNDVYLKVVKWDDSASGFVDVYTQRREINAFVGGRDAGFYNLNVAITLDQNDYVKLQVSNETATNNVTAELDSFFSVVER